MSPLVADLVRVHQQNLYRYVDALPSAIDAADLNVLQDRIAEETLKLGKLMAETISINQSAGRQSGASCCDTLECRHEATVLNKIIDFFDIVNAQLCLPRSAKARLSVRVRGRLRFSGNGELVLGDGVKLNGSIAPVELLTYDSGRIEIGNHTFINYGSSIAARASVKIGSHCYLGHYTFVMDNDQHGIIRRFELPPSGPVVIEDHVWIGSKAVILKGVRIGSRAVIGAGSVVTRDIPARCVAAGNPARVVRHLTDLD